jgi:hypothetical protein
VLGGAVCLLAASLGELGRPRFAQHASERGS